MSRKVAWEVEDGQDGETPSDSEVPEVPEPHDPPEQTQPEPEPPPLDDPPAPKPGEPPIIPDNAGDGAAGFMQGTWQSDSGLVDAQTQQKLTQEYTFDDQGRGEAVIRRADGVVCRAPAEATMTGGNLRVDELENLKCSDGSSFGRSRTVCTKNSSGTAECVGTDDADGRFKVDLNRGGRP